MTRDRGGLRGSRWAGVIGGGCWRGSRGEPLGGTVPWGSQCAVLRSGDKADGLCGAGKAQPGVPGVGVLQPRAAAGVGGGQWMLPGGFWLQQCRVTAPEKGSLWPRVGCVGSGIEWTVDGDLVLVVWGCCGKLGSGTPKPKNVEFGELGRLCELLCRCFGERCPCEVGEYKDLWSC